MANEFRIKNGFLSTGNSEITGSLIVTSGITGSLFGTASYATQAATASFTPNALVTASIAGDTITFTKGDGSTFPIVVPSGSGGGSGSAFPYTGSAQITGSLVITGSIFVTQSHISTVDYIDFTTLPTPPAFNTGRLHWTDDTKTLQLDTDVNGFELEIGHQSVLRGRNVNSFTLTKGLVVYIDGESGNRPTFATASWEGDPSSATTIGIIAQDINSSQTGYAVTNGLIRGINTNAFTPGTSLYLSASGQYTSTPPTAPLHNVRLGKTITQATSGIVYVDIDNGYELAELHDVKDTTTSASYGDLLVKSGSIWITTNQLTGSYGLTGSLTATSFTGSLYGTASWAQNAVTASYVAAAGSNTQIQYNNGGSFAATASFAFIHTSQSLQQGLNVTASGDYSHAQGFKNIASGSYSHAEGSDTFALGASSHAEGKSTQALGQSSHAEGANSIAAGDYSHAEGDSNTALGDYSHAEGSGTTTIKTGTYSHTEGYKTKTHGVYSHAEGFQAESYGTAAHAEGFSTVALGNYSHAEGIGTMASGSGQLVIGSYNQHGDNTSLFIIGNGANTSSRRDIFRVTTADAQITGSFVIFNPVSASVLMSANTASGVVIFDTAGTGSISAESRQAYDTTGVASIDWNSRVLSDIVGSITVWDAANQYNTIINYYQQLTLIGDLDAFSQYSTNHLATNLTQNVSGEMIKASGLVDAAVSIGDLVYLNSDGIWYKTDQTSVSSSYMLGICAENFPTKEYIFLEGNIGFATSSIVGSPYVSGSNFYGVPIYISGSNGAMSTEKPTSGIVRVVGHAFYNSVTAPTNWLMKFRPSNDWYEI